MTNLLQSFLNARGAKPQQPKQPVVNVKGPVTRAEFDTLVLAVNALIDDFDTVASPEKITGMLSEAVANVKVSPIVNARDNRGYLAPRDDDELGNIMPPRNPNLATVRNAQAPGRKPLALAPDHRAYLAPKGD